MGAVNPPTTPPLPEPTSTPVPPIVKDTLPDRDHHIQPPPLSPMTDDSVALDSIAPHSQPTASTRSPHMQRPVPPLATQQLSPNVTALDVLSLEHAASTPTTPIDADVRQPMSAPGLMNRRSTARASHHKRRVSGSGGAAMAASHFSKPIEMPPEAAANLRIEPHSKLPTVNSEKSLAVSPAELVKRHSAARDDAPTSPNSRKDPQKGTNTLKKQITKVVPTISKIAVGKHRKRVKDGEVVFKGHRNWEIVLSIQFGLRYTSELLDDANGHGPTEKDFQESLAFDFNPVDDHRSVFDVNRFAKWVHPAPFVYRLIREKFGVSETDFIEATCSESRVRELPTPGKSGALFYITDDENYFMKTIQHIEEKMLVSMLPSYYKHICDNPKTFLTKYMAHFSVQTTRDRHIRMVVMASIFNEQVFIDRKYDLKGSTYKRFASAEQLQSENVTLKDQDFTEPIFFRPEILEKIMAQLSRDSAYLESHSVMDYSLLLGLSDMMPEEDMLYKEQFGRNEENAPYFVGYQKDKDGIKSGVRVCMGIIDFLQRFRFRKKVEYGARVMQSCSSSAASVAPPHLYRSRFMAFLETRFYPDPDLDVSKLVASPSVSGEKGGKD